MNKIKIDMFYKEFPFLDIIEPQKKTDNILIKRVSKEFLTSNPFELDFDYQGRNYNYLTTTLISFKGDSHTKYTTPATIIELIKNIDFDYLVLVQERADWSCPERDYFDVVIYKPKEDHKALLKYLQEGFKDQIKAEITNC